MLNELVKAAGNKTKQERKKFVYAKKYFLGWLIRLQQKKIRNLWNRERRKKEKNSAETFIRENVARILKHPSAV